MSLQTLFLVRHAKSSWDDRITDDFDRPLNDRGRRDAPLMGKRIADLKDAPRITVTSPAKRAATTARLIAEAIGVPAEKVVLSAPLYAAPPDTILGVINQFDDYVSSVLLVGHNRVNKPPGCPGPVTICPPAASLSTRVDRMISTGKTSFRDAEEGPIDVPPQRSPLCVRCRPAAPAITPDLRRRGLPPPSIPDQYKIVRRSRLPSDAVI